MQRRGKVYAKIINNQFQITDKREFSLESYISARIPNVPLLDFPCIEHIMDHQN